MPDHYPISFYAFIFSLLCIVGQGQVFRWQNPNIGDSLKRDSILRVRMGKDFFKKDTLDFIRKRNKIIVDEGVLVKKHWGNLLGDLQTKGSIVRGITFGNNQGSSVESAMDFQVSGKLSKEVSVSANIFDNNLPMQADGYTQTLEDFDRIFIRLDIKKHTQLQAGHIDLDDAKTYFGKYQRRSMGLMFKTQFGSENPTRIHLSAGIARSEFHRVRFQGVEGNQGPYRLLGKNGEPFITIISGSEQVFMDGIPMNRGEDKDYTINYNTGELTFTSSRPVYGQNFITISYNYTNRHYSKYLTTGGITYEHKRMKLGLNWFWENDNKNAPLALNLSQEDKAVLAEAANDTEKMYAPSGVETEYDVNKILYRRVKDARGSYYEFSTDASETLYQVSFTYLGEGKGDYRLTQGSNNGRVFEFAGQGLGAYSAVRKLPSPQKTQLFSANAEYALDKGKISADISLSHHDNNLFSSKNHNDNWAYAGRIFATKSFKNNRWTGTPKIEYRYINRNFHILDRINDVEFSRDFNIDQEFNQRTQNHLVMGWINGWDNGSKLDYHLNFLQEKNFYRGLKNDLNLEWIRQKFRIEGRFSYLDTKSGFQDTQFTRGNIAAIFLGKKGSWNIGGATEYNTKHLHDLQRIDVTSFRWKELFVQKKIGDSTRTKLMTKFYFRTNDSVRTNRLERVNHMLGLIAESQMLKSESRNLTALFHYRKILPTEKELTSEQNQDFVVGNVQYRQQWLNNGIRLQLLYELGHGQEAQREFQYLKVTDGQGIYKWTDYNGDAIQQLDEFEVAEYRDLAQYIRIYRNSVKYLPSNKNKLQLGIFINPASVFGGKKPFLNRWNLNVSVSSQNSFLKGNKALILNPFERNEKQILKNQNLLTAVHFNPTAHSGWSGSYRFVANNHLINANFSNEEKKQVSHVLTIGYRFNNKFRMDWKNQQQDTQNTSQLFTSRDYKLLNLETKPTLIYKISESFLSEISSTLRHKKRMDGEEYLRTFDLSGTLQWSLPKTTVKTHFSFINNDFTGQSFSIVGNQMLEGLKIGKNAVWSLSLQQAVNSFIQLNLNYEGRSSGGNVIHTGSMQLKANF